MRVVATFGGNGISGTEVAGAVLTLISSYAERGEVTSVAPLRVLGQQVTVTADTGMTSVPGLGAFNAIVGAILTDTTFQLRPYPGLVCQRI